MIVVNLLGYGINNHGLIIQWGAIYSNSPGDKTVTLPIPFTTTNFSIITQQGSTVMGTVYYCNTQLAYPKNTTSFILYTAYGESCNVYWIAVGY